MASPDAHLGGTPRQRPQRWATWLPSATRLLRRAADALRPVRPQTAAALARRWAELPEQVRTDAQTLGRHAVGCEGTHGVFPRCNLTCTPCYHSSDANKVRVDGPHTLATVEAQMRLLREQRGPRAHTQLIGGEVSLLAPDDHAAALRIMAAHGREPMSFTHGDFDDDYLRALALDKRGHRRFRRLSFAVHVDSLMRGRRTHPRPRGEAQLNGERARFAAMFGDLRAQHGVRSFLAHNMTVTPANLGQVAQLVRPLTGMGYGLLSFQPAAYLGDQRRWTDGYRAVDADAVWQQIEAGLGQRVPHGAVLFGHPDCNRTALGFLAGERWHPWLDPDLPCEAAARARFYAHFGGMDFGSALSSTRAALLLPVKVAAVLARHPGDTVVAARWAASLVRRCGGARALARAVWCDQVRAVTFEVHSFIDADQVAPAWRLLQQGTAATDPALRAAQDRLRACTYSMAHPETGQLVPACVQHAVLDPVENTALRRLLPLTPTGR